MHRFRFAGRIARHQLFALPRQMQQPGAALEYFQFAIAQEGHLAEGLVRQVIGLPSVERDRSHRIGKSGFLARPPQPQIAHKAAGTFGHPIVGPDDQFAHSSGPIRAPAQALRSIHDSSQPSLAMARNGHCPASPSLIGQRNDRPSARSPGVERADQPPGQAGARRRAGVAARFRLWAVRGRRRWHAGKPRGAGRTGSSRRRSLAGRGRGDAAAARRDNGPHRACSTRWSRPRSRQPAPPSTSCR